MTLSRSRVERASWVTISTSPASILRNNGSILPEPIEAVGAQLGIPHRLHDVAAAEVVLERAGRSARKRSARRSGARQRLLPDAENFGGGGSFFFTRFQQSQQLALSTPPYRRYLFISGFPLLSNPSPENSC